MIDTYYHTHRSLSVIIDATLSEYSGFAMLIIYMDITLGDTLMEYLGLQPGSHNGFWRHPMHKVKIDNKVYVQAVKGNCHKTAEYFAISREDIENAKSIRTQGKYFYIQ